MATGQDLGLQNSSLMSMLPTLSGNKVHEFFQTLDEIAILGKWNEEQRLIIAKLKLEGKARHYYEASLKSENVDYKKFREHMIEQFKDSHSFSTLFARFSSASQFENESVREFGVRLEGLAHQSLDEKMENDEKVSEKFKNRLLLSQFVAGLRKNIKSQVMIMNPTTFPEAIQLAERIEKTLEIMTPNVNVAAINHQDPSDLAQVIKTTTECYAKSLELVTQQLQALNARLDKVQEISSRPYANNPGRQRQVPTCNYCQIVGHKAPECRKRIRDRGQNQGRYQSNFQRRGPYENRQPLN
ncbi:hypothetical protein AVEN_6809-1 [Araneus ventricosus]|uniref:Retrotransposon gag domain-containing protein n=1 Tax=Araneus ventricosus TaxID=182803 RepID=A0A4Y2I6Z1_ARAVE|nr:hypothetical protein AVEN_6809-1 [Araneus ventricosus]